MSFVSPSVSQLKEPSGLELSEPLTCPVAESNLCRVPVLEVAEDQRKVAMNAVNANSDSRSVSVGSNTRTIRVLYVIGFMDLCAVSMVLTLVPKFLLTRGASPFLAGLLGQGEPSHFPQRTTIAIPCCSVIVGSVYGGVQVFSSPAVGRLSDVYGRKPVLFLVYAGPALGYLMMGVFSSLWVIALARVVLGMLKQGQSVSKAYLVDLAKSPAERQSVIGFFNSCSSFGFIVGPLIGGELAALDHTLHLPFLTCGSVFVAISLLLACLLPGEGQATTSLSTLRDRPGCGGGVVKGLGSLLFSLTDLNLRELGDIFLLRFVMSLAVMTFRSNYPLYLNQRYGVEYRDLGKVLSFSGLTGAVASALSGRVGRIYGNGRVSTLYFHGTVLLTASLTLALSPSAFLAVAALVPLSLATASTKVTSTTMTLGRVPHNRKGTAVGLGNSLTSLSRMIAPLLAGVAQETSTTAASQLSVVLSVVASGLAGTFLLTCW